MSESTNGELEKIEHAIKNIEDVSEVEVVLVRRI
jgi:translation elongation factor EF-1beta